MFSDMSRTFRKLRSAPAIFLFGFSKDAPTLWSHNDSHERSSGLRASVVFSLVSTLLAAAFLAQSEETGLSNPALAHGLAGMQRTAPGNRPSGVFWRLACPIALWPTGKHLTGIDGVRIPRLRIAREAARQRLSTSGTFLRTYPRLRLSPRWQRTRTG